MKSSLPVNSKSPLAKPAPIPANAEESGLAPPMNLTGVKPNRKQGLIKRCNDYADMSGLKVTLVIFDEHTNQIEEFNSSPDFGVRRISEMIADRDMML